MRFSYLLYSNVISYSLEKNGRKWHLCGNLAFKKRDFTIYSFLISMIKQIVDLDGDIAITSCVANTAVMCSVR